MKVRTFVYGNSKIYTRCSKVLKYSINKFNPDIDFEIIHVKDKDLDRNITSMMGKGRNSHDTNNALKTKYQMELVQSMENGELLCLLDSDMMCTGEIRSIDQLDFDLALTDKEGLQIKGPINSGVIFVRISDKTKEWFRRWWLEAEYLLNNVKELRAEKAKFAGINQSALDRLMRQEHDLNIKLIPCRIWNSTVVTWPLFNEETKLVHILASLRNNIFYRARSDGKVNKLAGIFRRYEKEMLNRSKV